MGVNAFEPAILGAHLAADEHGHALPGSRSLLAAPDPVDDLVEELPGPGCLDREIGPDDSQVRRKGPKHAGRAKRTNHLVVAEVNDEQVGLALGALPGDGQRDMGVDRHHRGVDDLKARVGIAARSITSSTRAKLVEESGNPIAADSPRTKIRNLPFFFTLVRTKGTG